MTKAKSGVKSVHRTSSTSLRLNKAIASSGICSRRDADLLIQAGRVSVNGKLMTELATVVDPKHDLVAVDGKKLPTKAHSYIALHKPKGVITSCEDERNRKCVLDLLPPSLKHLKPVGRLDRDSSGLLLLTNDGDLIYALTHPSQEVDKTYLVTVSGRINKTQLAKLASGVELAEGITNPARVNLCKSSAEESVFEILIRQGMNRQIRRMCSQVGLSVSKLTRVAVGGLQLGTLKAGSWRVLSETEVNLLLCLSRQGAI
jgi:pseudouridine synthase